VVRNAAFFSPKRKIGRLTRRPWGNAGEAGPRISV
jgi:hypothetical protein